MCVAIHPGSPRQGCSSSRGHGAARGAAAHPQPIKSLGFPQGWSTAAAVPRAVRSVGLFGGCGLQHWGTAWLHVNYFHLPA